MKAFNLEAKAMNAVTKSEMKAEKVGVRVNSCP